MLAKQAGILSCTAQIQAWTDPEDVLSKGNFGKRDGRIYFSVYIIYVYTLNFL